MPARLVRHQLSGDRTAAAMLRAFRDRPGLFGLVGSWHDARTVIGFDPVRRLPVDADPFDTLAEVPARDAWQGFGGGWVGALGYRLGGRLERLPPSPPRPVPLPDFTLQYYDHVLVHDHDGWWFEGLVDDGNQARLDRSYADCRGVLADAESAVRPYSCTEFVATPDAAGHRAAVARTLKHLVAGDIFQANVCRRFAADFAGDPLDAFCAGVESLAPSYAAFLRTAEGAIVSLSPELFLRRNGSLVQTSPIKGTAPLEVDVSRLVASAKDRAENVMIVDLMRNDLGRVCLPGSVRVDALARAVRRTGVWHLVSDVVGRLAPDADDGSLLRATFPPGSVTGAPKVRAMDVIAEVESTGRELYTGAIGYVSPAAGLELNVAIRTFEFASDRVWFGAGGGVVIDSTPEAERGETLVKARPMVEAIGARLASEDRAILDRRPAPMPDRLPSWPIIVGPPVDATRGVFTTMSVSAGRPLDLAAHLSRLRHDVATTYRTALPDDLADQVEVAARALKGRHRLRVTWRPAGAAGSVQIATSMVPDEPRAPLALVPIVVPGGLGAHKHADRRRLDEVGAALVLDVDGSVLETWKGNLFVVTDEAVHTPAVDGRLLPGVTRRRAIEVLEAAGIPVIQRQLSVDDLASAVEIFATGSIDRVRPVIAVEEIGGWPVGRTTEWLARRLDGASPSPPARLEPKAGTDLLLVDNYDSFVYNLDQYARELGARTRVVRNDSLDLDEIERAVALGRLHGVVISPGPGTPEKAGLSTALVERLAGSVPILGVCLGHQCIAAAYGATIGPADTVVHGKPSIVHHDGQGVYDGLVDPMVVGRYHSLVVGEERLPSALVVTARTGGGAVMGIRHRVHPVEGVQFHPESILSHLGHHLLATFLHRCESARRVGQP